MAFIVSRGVRIHFSVGKAEAAHLVNTPLDNPPALPNINGGEGLNPPLCLTLKSCVSRILDTKAGRV